MSWMWIANLDEKRYSPILVNEFYSRLLLRSNEYENPPQFNTEVLYTFINGHEKIITKSDLGKLVGYEFYEDVFEAPRYYQTDNVWDTLAREPSCKKMAFNLKSLPLRFLHHFIASSIQCRTGAFTRLTTDDIGYLRGPQQELRSILLVLSWRKWWKSWMRKKRKDRKVASSIIEIWHPLCISKGHQRKCDSQLSSEES